VLDDPHANELVTLSHNRFIPDPNLDGLAGVRAGDVATTIMQCIPAERRKEISLRPIGVFEGMARQTMPECRVYDRTNRYRKSFRLQHSSPYLPM
jgi:hypothetical protein